MAVSFSRPDPSSPAAVASASFPTARRGFDAGEVRDFLRMVAAELGRLQERERFLERELQAVRRRPALDAAELDEQTVTELLGAETARVLTTAREAAAQIRGKAEEGAARLLREAQDEAARLKEAVELEVVHRRQAAERDATAEIEQAKQHGRDMVNEARAYRERVLADMTRRRDAARDQIQQLIGGRERLVQAFERARLVTADVLSEITGLVDDTDDTVDLASPTTGPLPMVDVELPSAPIERAVPVEAAEPVEAADLTAASDVPAVDGTEDLSLAPVVALFAGELDDHVGSGAVDDTPQSAASAEPVEAPESAESVEPVESVEPAAPDEPALLKPSVDDLFARLKAARAGDIARDVASDVEAAPGAADAILDEAQATTEAEVDSTESDAADGAGPSAAPPIELAELDESPFVRRDDELAHLEVTLARRLKRVLADEQSDLLDVLRGKQPVRSIDALLPGEADQIRAYADAASDDLRSAALLGAASMAHDPSAALDRRVADDDVVARVSAAIATEIVLPLRERVTVAVSEADGDARELGNMLRATYREWKTQRLDDHAAALLRSSYGLGAASAIVPGTAVCWMIDPSIAPCDACRSNQQAGVVRFGDEFPSGDRTPPVHPGCRCLLVETDR